MNILLTGGTGGLGSELKKILPNCLIPTKQKLDITDRSHVFDFFQKNSIDIVIHTAAITKIRFCQKTCMGYKCSGNKKSCGCNKKI